tara:strand:+ start:1506 stop:1625 length:120 start_codon:yes stop_codon:yes gene_type:complete
MRKMDQSGETGGGKWCVCGGFESGLMKSMGYHVDAAAGV